MEVMSKEFQEAFSSFENNFIRFADIASNTSGIVSKEKILTFAALAKADHVLYVQKAYGTMKTGTDSQEAKAVAVSDKECRFGRWLVDESGGMMFKNTKSYQNIFKPHENVHENAHKTLEVIAKPWENDPQIQEEIIGAFKKLEHSSKEVMNNIDKMVKESV